MSDLNVTSDAGRFTRSLNKANGPRVLVADIETFPIEAYVWGTFKQNVGLEQIKTDWSLMSFAAKPLNQPTVFYADVSKQRDLRDDKALLKSIHAILGETDFVIAHNGARFDLPKLRARMAMHRLPPLPPISVIDTLLLNRKAFGFTSHRLAFVSERFAETPKDDHAQFYGFKLWRECLAGNKAAWKECREYNITDVTALEETYRALNGWYEGAHNFGPYVTPKAGEHVCPSCGGTHVIRKGTRKTQVGIYPRFHCLDCGSWSRGRFMEVTRQERAHILSS